MAISPKVYRDTILKYEPFNYYRLNDTGNPVVDSGSNPQNGTSSGGVTFSSAGIVASEPADNALAFNGTDGVVDFTGTTVNGFFTVSLIVRFTTSTVSKGILLMDDGGSENLRIYTNGSSQLICQHTSTAGNQIYTLSPVSINTNYHITFVYRDGEMVFMRDTTVTSKVATGTNTPKPIALKKIGSDGVTFLEGTIDEVAVMDLGLTNYAIGELRSLSLNGYAGYKGKQLHTNNYKVNSPAISDTQTEITLSAGAGKKLNAIDPAVSGGQYERLTLSDTNETLHEVVYMTGREGDVITVKRGMENTKPRIWALNSVLAARFTAESADTHLKVANPTGSMGARSVHVRPVDDDSLLGSAGNTGTDQVSIGYQVAISGLGAVGIGKQPTVQGAGSVGIGSSCTVVATQSVGIGDSVSNYANYGVVLGYSATADSGSYRGIAIGHSAEVASSENGIAMGYQAISRSAGCMAIGWGADATDAYNTNPKVAIGKSAYSAGVNSLAIGNYASNKVDNTSKIAGMPIVAAHSKRSGLSGSQLLHIAGPEIVIVSKVVDVTNYAGSDYTLALPSGAVFFPSEVGFVSVIAVGVTVQPDIQFGNQFATNFLLPSTATTGIVAPGQKNKFDSLSSIDFCSSLTCGVVNNATATALTGRFYWKGVLIEQE